MNYKQLDKPISAKGLNCMNCNSPIDCKTTTTMLCKNCSKQLVAEKIRKTMQERYGVDNPMQKKEFIDKIQTTMKMKYGVNCAMNVPEFRDKFKSTCKERYGVDYYVNSEQFITNSSCKSKTNEKFVELLTNKGIEVKQEKVLDDKRFDIEIIGRKILVEIDPTYTHNSAGSHWDPEGHPKEKQAIKTAIADKYGYRCIHVFDWDNWEDIIDLIRDNSNIIYARKCSIKEITDRTYDAFIDANHIQKQCKGTKVALGLYYKEELVQVMTFGKPRYNKNYMWELLRLCSKKSCNVIGGASKLFKYATSTLNMNSIISYCDKSKFSGKVYEAIGMRLLRESIPQEIWSKGKEHITGSLLRQRGYDQLFNASYGKGTSNEQLMLEHGWLPIYDCGQKVFVYGEPISKDKVEEDFSSSADYSAMLKSIDKSKEKLCEFCGEPFVPKSNFQRYCKRPHYMNCPVCGKQYLVTNNENLKRPPVACSYACRVKRTQETSLKKYGMLAPGNNPEARQKAKETSLRNNGVEYAMQSEEVREKAKATLLEKYGVENIKQVEGSVEESVRKRQENWKDTILKNFPIKINSTTSLNEDSKLINEDELSIYVLRDSGSLDFLNENGHCTSDARGKIHTSIGLVKEGVVYQVLRFERKGNDIILADFGTLKGYYNPNQYTKLLDCTIKTLGIDRFKCKIPRSLATLELTYSLSLRLVERGSYDVFWVMEDKSLKKLTQRDNIRKMKSKYDYITTDYLDTYEYVKQAGRNESLVEEVINPS